MLNLFRKDAPFYRKYKITIDRNIIENGLAISLKYKYIYARIYKSANSTVVSSLYNAEQNKAVVDLEQIQDIKDNYFKKPGDLSKQELLQINDFYKFTIVRNPYHRLLSAYLDKIQNKERPQRKIVTQFLDKHDNEDVSLDEFIYFLENGGLYKNGHWLPQTDFLVFPIKDFDYIGKLEQINTELPHILEEIYNKPVPIVTVNTHKTSSVKKTEEITNAQKKRIHKIYQTDFENFKYSTE